MTPVDLDYTIKNHINDKAALLEEMLRSDVIFYSGPIVPQLFRIFRNFVEEVKSKSERTEDVLSVVLRTGGGSAETTERMVNVLRHHYATVNFIVSDMAMSAGTIFCMSGDRIFMDYASALGPIDPQVLAPDGSGYVAALGYLDKVEEIAQKANPSPADVILLSNIDLAKLALYEQARNLSISLLKRWLAEFKFKDWTHQRTTNRGAPVTPEDKQSRAEDIASALSNNQRWHSHGRALGIAQFNELRLEIDDYSRDDDLRDAIRGYNDPLTAYADRQDMPICMHSRQTEIL